MQIPTKPMPQPMSHGDFLKKRHFAAQLEDAAKSHVRICVSVTMEPQAEGDPKPVTCGHPVADHDSGGCCRVNRCPCSHLVLTKQDEFDPTEPKAAKEINPEPGKVKQ